MEELVKTLIRLLHNRSFVNRSRNEAQIFMDYFEGKDASEILFEIEKARAKIQPCGDVTVPIRSLEKSCILPKAI